MKKLLYMLYFIIVLTGFSYVIYNLYIMTPYYGSFKFKVGDCIVESDAAEWEEEVVKIINMNTYKYQYVDCYIYCRKYTSNTKFLYLYEKTTCPKELEKF